LSTKKHSHWSDVFRSACSRIGLRSGKPLRHLLPRPHLPIHVRDDESRGNTVHLYSVPTPFGRETACKAAEGAFGHSVDSYVRETQTGSETADDNDLASGTAFDHAGPYLLGQIDDAMEVRIHDALVFL